MIFSYLFQPNKAALSPAGRAFIAWLEIVIIGTITAGAAAGLDYLNGHPGDFSGMLPIIESTVVISLLKALSVLSIPRANPQPEPVSTPAPQPKLAPMPAPVEQPAPVYPLPQSQFAPMMGRQMNTQDWTGLPPGTVIPPAGIALPTDTYPWASIGGPPQARQ